MSSLPSDVSYMDRCIELAYKGGNNTGANPMVGALLVYNGRIIGEGYHQKFGHNHAEVNAIRSVGDNDRHLVPLSTLYVSLEPCSHYGKTPPCAEKIIQKGIKKVVIGSYDPNPSVSGRGAALLMANGVDITIPVKEQSSSELLDKFKANLSGIPYVILKWAQSKDNYLSDKGKQTWLSNPFSGVLVHKWRSECDAILIGKNTALIDNPKLNVRHYIGQNPLRILLDSHLEVNADAAIVSDQQSTIVFNHLINEETDALSYIKVEDTRNISEILHQLFQKGINSIIVEGGLQVLNSFIQHNLWHEARIIRTDQSLNDGIPSPNIVGKLYRKIKLVGDEVLYIKNNRQYNL
jgi:diaminohydroxyphosphoribosylaminopyrimidine deaminase/5-amino-6-(5-phosphoribosylamino)uracil reductase